MDRRRWDASFPAVIGSLSPAALREPPTSRKKAATREDEFKSSLVNRRLVTYVKRQQRTLDLGERLATTEVDLTGHQQQQRQHDQAPLGNGRDLALALGREHVIVDTFA